MKTKKSHGKLKEEEIRKRANQIWKKKCQSLNTALDDWLQAERELKAQSGLKCKTSDQYTPEEVARIRARAQAIRDEKVQSLRSAFDDWIQAENELKAELEKRVALKDLFDLWFRRAAPRVDSLLEGDPAVIHSIFDSKLGKEYVDLMLECMK